VPEYLDTVDDEEIRDLARRIDCEVDTSMDEQATGDSVPVDITVKLKNGAEHSIYVSAPKGNPSSPFTRDDHVTRFKNKLRTRYS
jgi:2-methylcitrate dehydratase PrpD